MSDTELSAEQARTKKLNDDYHREISEYIEDRCDAVTESHSIHIANPDRGEYSVTVKREGFDSRVKALRFAEKLAKLWDEASLDR